MANRKKDSYWFTHDADAASDPKMVALISHYGFEGYGRYWRIIELLRTQTDYKYDISQKFAYTSLATALSCKKEDAQTFIQDCIKEFDLFRSDDQYVWSESFNRRMEPWDTKKAKLSQRGKAGAAAANARKAEDATRVDAVPSDNSVLKEYKSMPKDKKTLYEFIRDKSPKFIDPYVEFWNIFAEQKALPKVSLITEKRKKHFKTRLGEPGFNFIDILHKAGKSQFICTSNWFTFDWIITSPSNYLKVIEGNYDNKVREEKKTEQDHSENAADRRLEDALKKK